jgi:hypothetical protein
VEHLTSEAGVARLSPAGPGRQLHRTATEPGVRLPPASPIRHFARGAFQLQRRIHPRLRGASAVRWPVLSLGIWLARAVQIYRRVVTSPTGPVGLLALHAPGILLCLVAWNLGFAGGALTARRGSLGHETG